MYVGDGEVVVAVERVWRCPELVSSLNFLASKDPLCVFSVTMITVVEKLRL